MDRNLKIKSLVWSIFLLISSVSLSGNYMKDSEGRTMRIAFDQGNRFALGYGFLYTSDLNEQKIQAGNFSFSYTATWSSKISGEDVWKNQNRFMDLNLDGFHKNRKNVPVSDLCLFDGNYVRYSKNNYILVPFIMNRIDFPLDVGFSLKVGDIKVPYYQGKSDFYELTVIDSRFLLEILKTSSLKDSFTFGLGIHYSLNYYDETPGSKVEQQMAPFTAMGIKFRTESKNGFRAFNLGGDFIPVMTDFSGWKLILKGQVRYEQILLAVNDEPLLLFAQIKYEKKSQAHWNSSYQEIKAELGLLLSFQNY